MSVALRRSRPEAPVADALESLRSGLFAPRAGVSALDVDSLMVVRDDAVLLEHWAEGCPPRAPHAVYSVTKTVTAIAAGIAADAGLLDVETPVLDILGAAGAASDPRITVEHLLTMSSGRAAGDLRLTALSGAEALETFAALPPSSDPGTVFAYCSLTSHVLGLVVRRVTGERLLPFLDERLFTPLGIRTPAWETDRSGDQLGGSGLHLVTEDIARIGMLLRDRGTFGGHRVFSEAWHARATAPSIDTAVPGETRPEWMQGYGFQLWRGLHDVFRADGMLGQFCIVAADLGLVVVTTARTERTDRLLALVAELLISLRGIDLPSERTPRS